MNVMHLLATAGTGGIETLCKDYNGHSKNNNVFVVLWGENGIIANSIRENGGTVIELNSSKKDITKVYKRLCVIVKEYSIEAVVVHHAAPIMHFYMQLLKVKYGNIKTIAYAHGAAEDMCRHNDSKGLTLRKAVLSLSLKNSTQVIAISNGVKKTLTSFLNVRPDKIKVIYNGTDTSRFVPNINEKSVTIKLIYIGRLIKEKGVQTTLQCLSKLPKNFDWKFDIVGDGAFRHILEQQAVELGLTDRVSFLGNRNDVPELLKTHDIFIHMPEWEEGFGITIIEAMASGLLCICKVSGGIPEIIDNGINGILVHDKDELTNTLTNILFQGLNSSVSTIRENAVKKAELFDIKEYSRHLDYTINNL